MIGTQVGRYQIQNQLGKGGMGVVYKAHDPKLDRTIALKFLLYDHSENEEAHQRFIHEARVTSALDHPNICTIHDIGESDEGHTYIAMAYYEGETLKSRMSNGPLPIEEATEIALQIAEGLGQAHKKGIVHRDIKPANIFITDQGLVKILDFGIAKMRDVALTKTGSTIGTAAYMSPEQARGEEVDQRADIWSFGVIMYEILAGRRPFQANFWEALLYAILNEEVTPLSTHIEDIDKDLDNLVCKALSKNLSDRYESMDALLEDLHALKGTSLGTTLFKIPVIEHHAVGRGDQLATLNEGLQKVYEGSGLLMGVSGEAGIGKTTVVNEFLGGVAASGFPALIAKGQCSERLAGTEAYLPLFDILEYLLKSERDGLVGRQMREKAPWWYVQVASLSPDEPSNQGILEQARHTTQEQVKRELAAFFNELTASRPLIALIEDLHWADVSTVDLIAYLGARFEGMKILIVTTYRPVEMQLNKHPFLNIKRDMVSRSKCQEIELQFLRAKDIEEYLELEYPENSFPNELSEMIHKRTEGSPLFMADLVRDHEQREVIKEVEGVWQLTKTLDAVQLALPDSVKAMIERKIDQLDNEDRELITVASVQGFEFDSAVLATVLEEDAEKVEERLQLLEEEYRFIEMTGENEFPDRTLTLNYRFVHVLYQNDLYESLTRTKRARLSEKIAGVLEEFYGEKNEEIASELARLFEVARQFEKAVIYYTRGAIHASGVFAFQESIALSKRGLELLQQLPESRVKDQQELELQMTLGSSATAVFGYANPEVGQIYHRIRDLIDRVDPSREVILSTLGLHSYYLSTLKMHEALDLCTWYLDMALQRNDQTLKFFGHGLRGVTLSFIGDLADGQVQFEKAFAVYAPHMDKKLAFVSGQDMVLGTWNNYPWNLWLGGYPDRAVQWSNQAKELAEQRSNPHVITHFFVFAGHLYMGLRDAKKVLELSETNIAISEEHGFPWPLTLGMMHKGWAIAQLGKREEGLEIMQQGLETFQFIGFETWVQIWHAEMAAIYGHMGQLAKGLELLEESFAVVDKTLHRMWEAELHRIKGELLLFQDSEVSEVKKCYMRSLEVARKQQARSFELRTAVSLSRLLNKEGKKQEAYDLLSSIYNWFF